MVVEERKTDYSEIVGAVHLHSNYSDGSLSISEIAAIANTTDLDFLMFTDHNTLEPKRHGLEGWYGNVLVIIGCEINDSDERNHYLAFQIDREVDTNKNAADYVRSVKRAGGFGIIAHPSEKRNFSDAYPPYPWTAWEAEGFDGIEIWNQMSEWMEGITRRNIAWRIIHPLRSIKFPVWETLERWDDLNRKRRVVGIGGIDVHAYRIKIFKIIPWEIYPYKVQFKSIRTHLLIKNHLVSGEKRLSFREAEAEVFGALRDGRCFVSNYRCGDARGFRFSAEGERGTYEMGSRIRREKRLRFKIHSPLSGDISLLLNGKIIKKLRGRELVFESGKAGVYRVEIFRKRRGWIYSNPIVIIE